MDRTAPSIWKPALIGGAVGGVLGAIPIVEFLNCACCALVIGSGFLAAFLYSKECSATNTTFGPGNGAVVGVVAGVFYSVFNGIVAWLIGMISGTGFGDMAEAIEQIESNPQIPAEQAEMIISFLESGGIVFIILISVVVYLIFATLGGLIGGAVFKVEASAPAEPSASQ